MEFVVFREIGMKHASQTQFGRSVSAVQNIHAPGPDKWVLLQDLTDAAEHYGLNHRTLAVLKALLSFLPDRHIPQGPGAVVFPSNRTLSNRLSGMPESTLRRHLSALVASGIVSRQDSPNRKRYAKRLGGNLALAFGFDLSPLARLSADIHDHAQKAQQRQEEIALLRNQIMILRNTVIEVEGQGALTDETARLLRRKPCRRTLQEALNTLANHVEKFSTGDQEQPEMSGSDRQTERHIQVSKRDYSDSEPPRCTADHKTSQITLHDVLERCTGFKDFFPEKITGWRHLCAIANRLSVMMGIDQPVFDAARHSMGTEQASIVVLCMLEKASAIRQAGAYLRYLTQRAIEGQFRVSHMLNALPRQEIVS